MCTFLNDTYFCKSYIKFIWSLKVAIFTELNSLFLYNKDLQVPSSTLITQTDFSITKNVPWIIKKEHIQLNFNKIHFLTLLDKFKKNFKSKKTWLSLFEYYQINQNWLNNQLIFKKILFVCLNLNIKLLDYFIVYLFNQLYKAFSSKLFFDTYHYFLKKQFFVYLRCKNSFFLNIFTKKFYINQFKKELLYFLKNQTKVTIKQYSLSISNFRKKSVCFLGFHLILAFKPSGVILKANLIKIYIRFFVLGYMNQQNRPIAQFLEYFAFDQLISLIKLKFIIQSLNSYYKLVKNKKYLIFKIVLILKVSVSKVFTSKFSYKSRAQIFKFFKNDLSKFIFLKTLAECRVVWFIVSVLGTEFHRFKSYHSEFY